MVNNRIKPVDGLRAFAAFGVIWIHIWTFFHNPPLKLFSVDLYQSIAIVGNGVDFFFVISGFCMYLVEGNKQFGVTTSLRFLYKRFLRIAPAFYLSVLVYAFIVKSYHPAFDLWYNVFFHFLFLNNVVTGNTISGPFWSIGTEWHFYMILPLFIYLSGKLSVLKAALLFSGCSIILFCYVNAGYLSYNWWETQVLIRFPEFAVGIIAAYYFIKEKKLPAFLYGIKGLAIAMFIMYAGRLMKFTPVLEYAGGAAFLLRSFADTVMTGGFGILLFHLITRETFLSKLLSGKCVTYLGRISYSMYLWHSLSIYLLSALLNKMPFKHFNPVTGFIGVGLLTIVISHFSYQYLEAFYFNGNTKKPAGSMKKAI
ncbi:MAG: acyltransferase [Ferruginibacter sp.]|nr:acyltransferase [Ferruginibacter sp.]